MGIQRNLSLLWRRGADYIDRILRGAKPADILLWSPQSLAARRQWEHQRLAATVFPEGNRPLALL